MEYTNLIISIIIGASGFVLMMLFVHTLEFISESVERRRELGLRRDQVLDKEIRLMTSRMSDVEVVKLLLKQIKQGGELWERSTVWIFGNGQCVAANRRKWGRYLSKLAKKIYRIEYILSEPPDNKTTRAMHDLKDKLGEKFFAYMPSVPSVEDIYEIYTELEYLKNMHPTLIDAGPGMKAMWVEAEHKTGKTWSSTAHGIQYVPPQAMNKRLAGKFDEYLRHICLIRNHYKENGSVTWTRRLGSFR